MGIKQGVSQKIKTADLFLIGKLDQCLPKVATMVGSKKFFLVKPVECWKMPSWERNISTHDIIQYTQITTEKCFFYH